MRRAAAAIALVVALAAAAPALAQDAVPIPEGNPEGAPAFIGAPAAQEPVDAPPLAPQHPFLAANGRSNIHDDAYMSDAYEQPGPLGRGTTRTSTFQSRECASVTFDRRGRIVTICVGLDRPVLHLMDPVTLRTIATHDLPPRQPSVTANVFSDFSGGGYFYLDEADRAVLPTTTRHIQVIAQTADGTDFQVVRDVDVSGHLGPQDKITSVMPDWSGRLWFVTQEGVVGTLARDSDTVRVLPLGEPITNSFSVDETGGVFIVSDGALYRFDAAPDGTPVVSWREVYANTGVRKSGQVSPGSGTTPTLMHGGLVAITDNADPLQVVVYRRGRGPVPQRLVCAQPVFRAGAGSTDNSLIAAGRSIVVENNFGYAGPAATQGGRSTEPGVERVDVDPDTNSCRTVWRSEERSPSVVPKLSLANGLVYVYTKDPPASGDADLWYLTALSFRTGRTVFKVLSGEGLGYNNNYAPVSLGPDGAAYVGVLGGLVRLADATPPPGAAGAKGKGRKAGRRCLARRLRVRRGAIGRVVLGGRRAALRRMGARMGRRSARFCVRGGGRVAASFDRRGRVRLVVTTARRHRAGRVHRGSSLRALRRAFPGVRRITRGVWAAPPARTLLFRVRGGRVRWVATATRATSRRARTLRRALGATGL